MDISVLLGTLYQMFITRLDYNITYISLLFLLSSYASLVFKHFLKGLKIGIVGRFLMFSGFLIFGTNPVFIYLTNLVLSISQVELKWIVISGLLVWSFIKFDEDMALLKKG